METLIESMNNIMTKADYQVSHCGFKTLHNNYIHGYIGLADFYLSLFKLVNAARMQIGSPAYTPGEFDHAWQYRNAGAEKWSEAKTEIVNMILGWY